MNLADQFMHSWVREFAARSAKLIGILALLGWFGSIEVLTTWVVGSVAMMPATALMSLLIGVGVESESDRVVVGLGILATIAFVTLGYFDVVKLIGGDGHQAVKPGMPSWGTVATFATIGIDLMFGDKVFWSKYVPSVLGLAGLVALTGHAIDQPWMYFHSDTSTAMAIPTASALLCYAIGAYCRNTSPD